jgi:hypothetical protein
MKWKVLAAAVLISAPVAGSAQYGGAWFSGNSHPDCVEADDAKAELFDAAVELLNCTRESGHDDDCGREVRDVRDAGDDYATAQAAVSGGECD